MKAKCCTFGLNVIYLLDEAYILAYAVIMLNTTLNNPTASSQNIEFGKEEAFLKTMLEYDNMNFQEDLLRVMCCFHLICRIMGFRFRKSITPSKPIP